MATAEFRFYAELNRFIAPCYRQRAFVHSFPPDATVKHMIEALGVPHTEVELILANGISVDFAYRLAEGDHVSVYPHFRAIDTSSLARLPARPVHDARFIADAHLGRLARHLRMLGFDVLYRNSYSDAEVAHIASEQQRIVLTRDRDLLIRKDVVLGCYLHAVACEAQLQEVLLRFDLLDAVCPFTRCLNCNGVLHAVGKDAVAHRVPPSSARHYERFLICEGCGQVYWEGSHVARMRARIDRIVRECKLAAG